MINILSENTFCSLLEYIVKKSQFAQEVVSLCVEYDLEDNEDLVNNGVYFDDFLLFYLVRTLTVMFQDQDNELISYWVFERECGLIEDKNSDIQSHSQLYSRLIQNLFSEKELLDNK